MSLSFRTPVRREIPELCDLAVHPEQIDHVAPAAVTLAQAAYQPGSHVFGIWMGQTAVGLMAMIDTRVPDPEEDPLSDPYAYVWRLMIGADRQRNGFGRKAICFASDTGRSWGMDTLMLSVADAPGSARPFYEALGFTPTGKRVGRNEIEMRRSL